MENTHKIHNLLYCMISYIYSVFFAEMKKKVSPQEEHKLQSHWDPSLHFKTSER